MVTGRPAVFYGWWVALTAAAGLFLGVIPIVVFSFGLFLGPITRDFHAGRGAVSFAYTLFSLIQAMSVPFAGWLMDRFGARSVILPSMVLGSFVLLLIPFWSGSLLQFYVFFGTLGFLAAGAGTVAFAKVMIAGWHSAPLPAHRLLHCGAGCRGAHDGCRAVPIRRGAGGCQAGRGRA